MVFSIYYFFFSSRRRHTRWNCDWSSDVCSSDLKLSRKTACQPKVALSQPPAVGPTVGGWLSATFGWHAVFLLNLRSEERRVGHERRARWSADDRKENLVLQAGLEQVSE